MGHDSSIDDQLCPRRGRRRAIFWVWELRSVNRRGLDLRLRLPPGLERLEPAVRKAMSSTFQRGNIQLALTVSRDETPLQPVVNEAALDAVIKIVKQLADRVDASPPTLDGPLNLRGISEFREPDIDPEDARNEQDAVMEGLQSAIAGLVAMREAEGEKSAFSCPHKWMEWRFWCSVSMSIRPDRRMS